MFNPGPATTQAIPKSRPARRKRSHLDYLKCKSCRIDKQKCQPSHRQWPGEKCQRCLQRHLPCSEPQTARSSIRPPSESANMELEYKDLRSRPPDASRESSNSLQAIPVPPESVEGLPQNHHVGDTPADMDSQFQRLQIIKTAISRLTQLAQDMAEPFKKVPIWMDHAKCLDNIFVELDEFALSIAQEIKSLRFYGPNLLDMDSSSNTGHRISKTVDAESLQAVRHGIIALLNAKRYGRAYIAQLDLITRYPEYVTDGDLLQLEQSKTSFLSEPSLFQVMEEHAPETLKSVSLFLPLLSREILQRRPFKTLLVLSDKIRKHDFSGTKGQDCLGRSSYHVLADAGIQRRWHVLRINHQDILGRTALYFACRDGDERRITGLISSGANILLQTVTGLTPLHIAAAMGYNSACRLLWDAYGGGPLQHVVIYRDCTGCTPLLCAASTGRHETVRFFCEQVHMNSPLDYTDQHGNSALGLAVRAGNVTTVRLLMTYVVERRMSPDFADVKGRTPFWHAVAGSHYEMMQVMVDLVDPDRRDDDGRTPLAEAARTGDTIAVKFLLDLNSFIRVRVDQNCRDKAGKSVLILAAEAGQTQCAKLLLDPPFCGVYDKDVRTAVELAERSSNYELLEVLERWWN